MDHPSYGRQRRLDQVIMDMMQERNATEKNNNKTCESTTSSARVMQDAKLGLCFIWMFSSSEALSGCINR